jgi:thymidylate synthase (FAD)
VNVELIAVTRYLREDGSPEALLEHAGRVCYRSESRGDAGRFLRARVREGHESLVEHASATFEISGISRACSHQIVRHRLASYSQESQRYCRYGALEADLEPKLPPLPESEGEKYDAHCTFTMEQEHFIVEQYQAGFSAEKLAEAYDVHPTTIRGIVMRHNESMRSRRESRTMHTNTSFFAEIDTPTKAYVLGVIYADGNIAFRENQPSYGSITQHKDYAAWLKRLGALWGGSVIAGGRPNSVKLTIPGIDAAEHLVGHGVVQSKSKILVGPDLPDELVPHFVRGYLEGDGYISIQKPLITISSSSPQFLEWTLQQTRSVSNTGSISGKNLTWSGKFCVPTILDWLYAGYDFRLSHPAKLQRVIQWSEIAKKSYFDQVVLWTEKFEVVVPPVIMHNPVTMSLYLDAIEMMAQGYANLQTLGTWKEDARFVLPNAAATRIVVTMNFRELLHLFRLRISAEAQWEIRDVAVRMLELVYPLAPNVFGDLREALRGRYPDFFVQ